MVLLVHMISDPGIGAGRNGFCGERRKVCWLCARCVPVCARCVPVVCQMRATFVLEIKRSGGGKMYSKITYWSVIIHVNHFINIRLSFYPVIDAFQNADSVPVVCYLCASCVPDLAHNWHTSGTPQKGGLIFVICLENINTIYIGYGAVKYELLIPARSLNPA